MANTNLIVMLTWHDVTVENAKEIFLEAKDAPNKYWGCKCEGISKEKLRELLSCMKKSGKETFLETVAIDEESCLKTARLGAECGVDHLLGTIYFDSIQKVCDDAGMTYSPFIGIDTTDTRLRGTVEQIITDAKAIEAKDVWGISLSGFRYVSGDPVELIRSVSEAIHKPMFLAGGVNSYEKLDVLKQIPNLFAFTIGGAFFEKRFGKTFSEQIRVVNDYLRK